MSRRLRTGCARVDRNQSRRARPGRRTARGGRAGRRPGRAASRRSRARRGPRVRPGSAIRTSRCSATAGSTSATTTSPSATTRAATRSTATTVDQIRAAATQTAVALRSRPAAARSSGAVTRQRRAARRFTREGQELQITPTQADAATSRRFDVERRATAGSSADDRRLADRVRLALRLRPHRRRLVRGRTSPRAASTWYPVNDHPTDKATYDFPHHGSGRQDRRAGQRRTGVSRALPEVAGSTFVWEGPPTPMASYLVHRLDRRLRPALQ